jgi:ATP-dependent Clp protease ATP-binding subunit ClpC
VLERLSDPARRATAQAEAEARRLRHGYVGTEHLVLGVLADGDNAAARVLAGAGIILDACRDKVAEAVGPKRVDASDSGLAFTDRANRALERAGRLSLRRRTAHVGTVSIMLSVLDVEGTAGQVLRGLSVDVAALRVALEAAGDDPEADALEADAPRADPAPLGAGAGGDSGGDVACPVCGVGLDDGLGHRLVASRGEGGTSRDHVVVYCRACRSALGISPV